MKLVDNRGQELYPGADVAYNLSGQVAKGRITKLHPNASGYSAARVEVVLLHRACGKEPGHVSRITNPRNVLVVWE